MNAGNPLSLKNSEEFVQEREAIWIAETCPPMIERLSLQHSVQLHEPLCCAGEIQGSYRLL